MKYLSVSQIAEKWNLSVRSVRNYCEQGQIKGVFLTGKTWNIPSDSQKPIRKKRLEKKNLSFDVMDHRELDIVIVGGGISGVFAAIRLKEKHPYYHVSIFEKNNKLLKKIYATGNGKCNFGNSGSLIGKYNHEDFVLPIINQFPFKTISGYLHELGIESKMVGELAYPYSETAETVANKLLKRVQECRIDVHLEESVTNYRDNQLLTSKGTYHYDALIISCGGKAAPQLGSDGNLFSLLHNHHYHLIESHPSLCPIKVKEDVRSIEGLRAKVNVTLLLDQKNIHQEDGELLFKKDGLSGMVIFNLTHYLNMQKSYKIANICVDFAPKVSIIAPSNYANYLHPRLAKYLIDHHQDIHHCVFTFKDFYDYVNAQVTSGGVSIDEVNSFLQSNHEKDIYFTGEVLDVDAVCGGFNIMWALASAEKVSNNHF